MSADLREDTSEVRVGPGAEGRGATQGAGAGLRGEAAIIGVAEWKPEKHPKRAPMFTAEQWSLLAAEALADAGISPERVNGVATSSVPEAGIFAPATIAEYCGWPVDFAEHVDLGGATAAAMVWRAAAAIELGACDVVVCALPTSPRPTPPGVSWRDPQHYGSYSGRYGSPQAEFDVPYGNVYQNATYAMIAQRYAAEYGYDERAMAKIAVDQRTNACSNPQAYFHGQPLTVEDVLQSPVVADPLHKLEIVMDLFGGAAVVVASADVARRARRRPVWVKGFGEHLAFKTPTYAASMTTSPMVRAAAGAFDMAGVARSDIDLVSLYDCYTITVLTSIEDAGFCAKGRGMEFVAAHDLTFHGDFPCNTHGGQLSFGQAGIAGGMSHVCDATRQLQHRAGANQVTDAHRAFVSGNGGVMGEQVALILEGD